MPCYAMLLCYAMLCYAVLCCAMLCYAVLKVRREVCEQSSQQLEEQEAQLRQARPPTRAHALCSTRRVLRCTLYARLARSLL